MNAKVTCETERNRRGRGLREGRLSAGEGGSGPAWRAAAKRRGSALSTPLGSSSGSAGHLAERCAHSKARTQYAFVT